MEPLLGAAGLAALRRLAAARPLFAFDFDGTLAPIVSRPDDAHVPPAVAAALARLAGRAPVAVITGRAVADVQPRLGFEPAYVVGNHGAEDPSRPAPAAGVAALETLRSRISGAGAAPAGVVVEDKRWSLALHYRLASKPAAARAWIDAVLVGLDPRLARFGGKCVVNVVAADAPDKSDALFDLVARARCGSAFFAGDDVNDEVVFERAPPPWVTVRVGRDERPSAARYWVEGPAAMEPLLQRLSKWFDAGLSGPPAPPG